jgi:hypothetical protein
MSWVLVIVFCFQVTCTVTTIPMEDRELCMDAAHEVQAQKMNAMCIRTQHTET